MKQRDGAHGEGYQNFGSKSMVVTVYRLESTGGFGKPDVYADTDIMKVRIPCEHTCKETTWYREGVCLIKASQSKEGRFEMVEASPDIEWGGAAGRGIGMNDFTASPAIAVISYRPVIPRFMTGLFSRYSRLLNYSSAYLKYGLKFKLEAGVRASKKTQKNKTEAENGPDLNDGLVREGNVSP